MHYQNFMSGLMGGMLRNASGNHHLINYAPIPMVYQHNMTAQQQMHLHIMQQQFQMQMQMQQQQQLQMHQQMQTQMLGGAQQMDPQQMDQTDQTDQMDQTDQTDQIDQQHQQHTIQQTPPRAANENATTVKDQVPPKSPTTMHMLSSVGMMGQEATVEQSVLQQISGQQYAENMSNMYSTTYQRPQTTSLAIPSDCVGAVLGLRGCHVKQIQELTGVKIRISSKHKVIPGTNDRVMYLSGLPWAVQQAHYMCVQRIYESVQLRLQKQAETDALLFTADGGEE